MATAVPPSDDPSTARDRAEYLRRRNDAPVMSIASEKKVRKAMATHNPEAVRAARTEARERAALEDRVIGSMHTADFKAFHKAASEGSFSTADKLLEAAVAAYGRKQATQARAAAAPNIIEPVIAVERDSTQPSLSEPDTEVLRATPIERHGSDTANADNPTTDRSNRDRISIEREAIGRKSSDELQDEQAARGQGLAAAGAALDSAVQPLQAAVADRNAVRAFPPLEDRFNVIRHLVTKDYEFRDQPGKLAFTEQPLSMRTAVDNPSAVKAMVDRAMERGWVAIRLSGSIEFQRQAWIASTARGIKAIGHHPTPGDHEAASRERRRLAMDRFAEGVRPAVTASQQAHGWLEPAAPRDRHVMTALDKAMKDGKVPAELREQLRDRVGTEKARRIAQGHRFAVTVYDPSSPRPKAKVPDLAAQRTAEDARSR